MYNAYMCIHIYNTITINNKNVMNLKENGKGYYMEGFGGRKGKGEM